MKPQVNKERVQKLVDALRSGEYVQTTTRLRRDGNYGDGKPRMCCLGVACDISGVGQWGSPVYDEQETACFPYETPDAFGAHTSILPEGVRVWYGFDYGDPQLEHEGAVWTLTEINDSEAYTFKDIADIIEREFLT